MRHRHALLLGASLLVAGLAPAQRAEALFWSDIGNFFSGAIDRLVDTAKDATSYVSGAGRRLVEGTTAFANDAQGSLNRAANFLGDNVRDGLDDATGLANATVDALTIVARQSWDVVQTFAIDVWNAVAPAFAASFDAMVQTISKIVAGLLEARGFASLHPRAGPRHAVAPTPAAGTRRDAVRPCMSEGELKVWLRDNFGATGSSFSQAARTAGREALRAVRAAAASGALGNTEWVGVAARTAHDEYIEYKTVVSLAGYIAKRSGSMFDNYKSNLRKTAAKFAALFYAADLACKAQKGQGGYATCYTNAFTAGSKRWLFRGIVSALMVPLDTLYITPQTVSLALSAAISLAAVTSPLGAAIGGALVGAITRVGIGVALEVLSDKVLFGTYETTLWSAVAADFQDLGREAADSFRDWATPAAAPLPGLSITSATYGANCGAPAGNVTAAVSSSACLSGRTCAYRVDYRAIGDPTPGCAKTFEVSYLCNGAPRIARLGAEAHGQEVTLECARAAACERPPLWCGHGGATYRNLDCNGDGALDHVCTDTSGNRGTILSGSGGCASVWPAAPAASCPAVFGSGTVPSAPKQ